MFEVSKTFKFSASHQLPNHDGKCRNLHGHNWIGRVIIHGTRLATSGPKQGMVIDYSDIKSVLEPIVTEFLDHRHLNDTLAMHSPTSEAIAVWLFNKLKSHFDSRDYQLYAVEIEETDTCVTRFCPTMEL